MFLDKVQILAELFTLLLKIESIQLYDRKFGPVWYCFYCKVYKIETLQRSGGGVEIERNDSLIPRDTKERITINYSDWTRLAVLSNV